MCDFPVSEQRDIILCINIFTKDKYMKRNPLYSFRDRTTIGIFGIPLHSTIHILDDGDGKPMFAEIIAKTGLSPDSDIGQFLDDPSLYINLSTESVIPSELEKITEGTNTGWAIFDRDPINFGTIGQDAIDLSFSNVSSTTAGATGNNSFATGKGTIASGLNTTAMGYYTETSTPRSTAVGRYNLDVYTAIADNVFTVGIGSSNTQLKNGLVVYENGIIEAPEATLSSIENSPQTTLVTKEYSDIIDGGNI